MPDPRPPSDPAGRAGWRSKAKTPSSGPRAAKAGGWAKKVDDGVERSVTRYRTKVFLWSSIFLALVAGFVIWLLWTPKLTPFLAVTAVNYEYPLPPNAYAREDANRFRDLHGKAASGLDEKKVLLYDAVDFESRAAGLKELRLKLEKAEPGGPAKNALAIYLSMHGAVNEEGEPCLIPPDAPPLDSSKWLRVSELLEELKRIFAGNPKLRSEKVKKLLILDANRMDLNWSIGLLGNTFAERLPAVVKDQNVPGLVVLNSASPGQIGWAAPELRNSVFGYFLWRGLSGAARPGKNGEITLRDLFAYLNRNVKQWVSEKRADDQTPMLIPSDAVDFPLVFDKSQDQEPIPHADISGDARWDKLRGLWDRHAKLKNDGEKRIPCDCPQEWEKVQQGLLRLEQLAQAGPTYEEQFTSQASRTEFELRGLENRAADSSLAAYSLPLKAAFGQGPSAAEWIKLPPPWKEPAKTEATATASEAKPAVKTEGNEKSTENKPAVKAEEKDSAKEAAGKAQEKSPENKPAAKAAAKAGDKNAPAPAKDASDKKPAPEPPPPEPLRYSYLAASAAAWNWASQEPLDRKMLSKILQFVEGGVDRPNAGEAEFVETQFLRMLDKFLDAKVWEVSPQAVKQAIGARTMAETAAAPRDDRAFYGVFPQVDAGDALRREAEDRLFVGSAAALREAEGKWNDAAGNYRRAEETAKIAAAGYRARDRAYGAVPYLARWILSRTHRRSELDPQLVETAKTARRLALLLDGEKAGSAADEIGVATAALEKQLDELESAYFKDCASSEGEHKEKLARLLNVLAVPLVTGAQRNDYWKNCLKIAGASGRFKEAAPDGSTASAPADLADPYLAGLVFPDSRKHPLLLALAAASGEDDPFTASASAADEKKPLSAAELAAQGGRVRKLLNEEREICKKQLAETIRQAQIDQPRLAELNDIRRPLGAAERMVRAFAPLRGESLSWADPKLDPLHRLQNLDRHNLLLWQAWRTLQDFWGPSGPAEPPYFELTADAYLKSAAELFPEDAAQKEGAVCKRLESGREAARQGLEMEKPRTLVIDEEEASVPQSIVVSAADGFPPGEAAVFLQAGDDSLFPVSSKPDLDAPDLRRIPKSLPNGGRPKGVSFWILNDGRLGETPRLGAAAYFRGFLRAREFYVNSSAGWDALWVNKMPPKPSIAVRGSTLKKSNLMFILDCSGSMSKMVRSGSSQEGPVRERTRFEVVRDALERILEWLAKSPDSYNVGLMLYAHRVRWIDEPRGSKTNFQIVMPDPKNPAEFIAPPPNFNVRPSFDVEMVLPPGRFAKYECAAVKERLDALQPLGETPLYLSIIQALKALDAADPDAARHLIVLTDGGNAQFDRDNRQILSDPQLSKLLINLGDVEAAFAEPARKDVKMDVLGFDLDETNFASAEEKSSAQELMSFAKSRHHYYPVNDLASLTGALEKTVGLLKYEVQRIGDGKFITSEPLDLNAICETIDRPGDYRVQLVERGLSARIEAAKADVTVEGGEALELEVKENPLDGKRRLAHRRYEERLRDSADVSGGSDPRIRTVFLGAHLPEPTGGGARFFVSVQSADPERFSPRPLEVWAEITPVTPEGRPAAAPFIFYDRAVVPNRPVPVLEFAVPRWPPETEDAEIRFWCKFARTEPDRQGAVAELRGKNLQLEGVANVSFEVETKRGNKPADPFRVIVTESHSPGGDLGLVKVAMEPPPKSIKRRYNDKTGTIAHTFFYDDSAAAEADRYRILFTAKEKLKDGAFASPPDRPLKVKVPPSPL
ncbi:MAG: VWA domain-containing protein [Pirellulales bacterium]|nr:VWA domain-containing protein [Pirellulales bacterium]